MANFWIEIVVLSLLVVGSTAVKESDDRLGSSDSLNLIQLIVKELIQRERLAVTVEKLQDKVRVLEARELMPQERLAVKVEELQDKDRVLEAKLKNLSVEISSNKRQVAFYGKLNRRIPLSEQDEIVKFDVVTTNIGDAYNTTTGIFRCPVAGLYSFSCNILSDAVGWITLHVYKNGVEIARPYTGVGIKGHETGSDTAVVHAEVGDKIYATNMEGTSAFLDHMSRFSGVLLKSD